MAKKNDPYNWGYENGKEHAADLGAEPEHHAYGGRMGKMPIRAPRLMPTRPIGPGLGAGLGLGAAALPGAGMSIPGGPRGPGMPGLGAAPGPMPMPGGAPPGLKRGGKTKHLAKGGSTGKVCKAEGGEGKVRHGEASTAGKPSVRGHGKEGIGENLRHGGKVLKKGMGGDIQTGRANPDGSPAKPHIPNAKTQLVRPKFKGKNAVGGG